MIKSYSQPQIVFPRVKIGRLRFEFKMFTFFKEVRSELSQVTWPTRKETIRLTVVVILISLVVGIYLGAADFLFTKLLQFIIQ